MPKTRKIIKVGNSRAVTISPNWLRKHEKKNGKPVESVEVDDNTDIIKIAAS